MSKPAKHDETIAAKSPGHTPEADAFLLEAFPPFQLAVVANRVSQAIAKTIDRKFNLHIPEWRMVSALAKYQPCSGQTLVEKTAMEPARVSRAQMRLVDLGLIDVVQDPSDRRRVIISLTAKGMDLVEAMAPEAVKTAEFLFGALSEPERQAFETVLAKLFRQTVVLEKGAGR